MKYDGYKNEFPFGSDILSNANPQVIFNGLGRGFPLLEIDDYIWNPNNRSLALIYSHDNIDNGWANITLDNNNLPILMNYNLERTGNLAQTIDCNVKNIKYNPDGSIKKLTRELSVKDWKGISEVEEDIYLLNNTDTELPGVFVITASKFKNSQSTIPIQRDGTKLTVDYHPQADPSSFIPAVGSENTLLNLNSSGDFFSQEMFTNHIPVPHNNGIVAFELSNISFFEGKKVLGVLVRMTSDGPCIIRLMTLEEFEELRQVNKELITQKQTYIPEGTTGLATSLVTPISNEIVSPVNNVSDNLSCDCTVMHDEQHREIHVGYNSNFIFPEDIRITTYETESNGEETDADVFFNDNGSVAQLLVVNLSWKERKDLSVRTGIPIIEQEDHLTTKTTVLDLGEYYALITLSQTESMRNTVIPIGNLYKIEYISKSEIENSGFVVSADLDNVRLVPAYKSEVHLIEECLEHYIQLNKGYNNIFLPNGVSIGVNISGLDIELAIA